MGDKGEMANSVILWVQKQPSSLIYPEDRFLCFRQSTLPTGPLTMDRLSALPNELLAEIVGYLLDNGYRGSVLPPLGRTCQRMLQVVQWQLYRHIQVTVTPMPVTPPSHADSRSSVFRPRPNPPC